MPDITMCDGQGCLQKNKCYRYRAEPTPYWQSYFMEAPYEVILKLDDKVADTTCDYFWPLGIGMVLKEIDDAESES